jgi:hypothetical protein
MSFSFTSHGRPCFASLRNSLVERQRPCYFIAKLKPGSGIGTPGVRRQNFQANVAPTLLASTPPVIELV